MTLFLAMLLDAALGEPKWLWNRVPHPAVLMGQVIDWADKRFNKGIQRRGKGILVLAALVIGALVLGFILKLVPFQIIDLLILAVLIAQRSLSDHVMAVAKALKQGLPQGRAAVAQIVGRDTASMDQSAVSRSAIESAAENLSDGVIAPIFWFIIGGLPGVLMYKIVNTADSMIGYLNDDYKDFGWAAAKFDDLLNYIPARITAVLMVASYNRFDMLGEVAVDAPVHRSPNAGWPEAAMAYVLNVALAGPRSYDGKMRDYAFVNNDGVHDLGPEHIAESVWVLWRTWGTVLIVAALFGWLFG